MKRKRSIVAVCLLTIVCVIGFVACDGGDKENRLKYKLSEDRTYYIVTGMTGSGAEVVIPNSHKDKPVKEIAAHAFLDRTALISVTIPDSVVTIGAGAFENCNALTIYCQAEKRAAAWDSDWNYSNCPVVWDCENNELADNEKTFVTIDGLRYGLKTNADNSKTAIVAGQSSAMSGAINIPASVSYKNENYAVTDIDDSAFKGLSSVTDITIADGVTFIGSSAFEGCSGLTTISLPESLTRIVYGAFDGCDGIIRTENGVSYIDKWAIDSDPAVTAVTLRPDTAGIGDNAFKDRNTITSFTVPDSVHAIGMNAFIGCNSITDLTIPFVGATKDSKGNSYFSHIFGGNFSIPASLKTVVITGGESIDDNAINRDRDFKKISKSNL